METRLAKRRRLEAAAQQALETAAQQALERNIAHFVGLGVPPGVVRRVLPVARVLRRVLPVGDMADEIALHYLWHARRSIRKLWSYLRPVSHTGTEYDVYGPASIRYQAATRFMSLRGRPGTAAPIVSIATFFADELGGIWSGPWETELAFRHDLQRLPSNPFFPNVYPVPSGRIDI